MDELAGQIIETILGLRGTTAYLIVGALTWAEAPFFLGLVTPGEIAMAVGGVLAWKGQVTLAGMGAAAAGGTVLGNACGFWLGRRWGASVLAWSPLQRVLARPIESAEGFLSRRGEWAIVVGQFVSYVRIFVPFLIGASGMRFRRYLAYAVPSAVVWSVGWVTLGFAMGEGWRRLQELAGPASFLVLALFLLALAIRWAAARVARRRVSVRAALDRLGRTRPVLWIRRSSAASARWLGRRFDPGVARGLGFTLGLLVLLLGAGAIGLVVHQVQSVQGIARIDYPVLEWMAGARTEAAVLAARRGLGPFRLPWFLIPTVLLAGYAWWRSGWRAAARTAVGLLGAGFGAHLLDEYALHAAVPRTGYPSIPVVVASSLLVHSTALVGARHSWSRAVGAAAVGLFLTCTVALAAMVAGWAAPSGVALGFGIGLTWSAAVELSGRLPRPPRG